MDRSGKNNEAVFGCREIISLIGWLIGLIASLIGIFAFCTGVPNIPDIIARLGGYNATTQEPATDWPAPFTPTKNPTSTWTPLPTETPTRTLPNPTRTFTPTPRPTKPNPTRTFTPTPRPPAPTYTSASTIAGNNCSRPVGERFEGIWNAIQKRLSAEPRLECPLNDARAEYGAAEAFERGYMLWRDGQDLVYVLYQDGEALIVYDKFREGVDPEKIGYTPPPGLQEPIRGFGKIWREHLGGPSSRIGWAIEHEYIAPNLVVQDFENGMIFWEDRVGNRVFFSSGLWEQW